MCGIAGIVNGIIYPLNNAQKHRGKDGNGVQFRDMVAFGHNRLSVIDLSDAGAQPISNERYMLTYNGEIYNYKEFYSGTKNDAHALLDSINRIGLLPTLDHLNGMYAFAVHDRVEHKIHLVVDRFGQKPLYYCQVEVETGKTHRDKNTGTVFKETKKVFAFASSPSALLHLKDKWSINKQALQSYWTLGAIMGSQSIWDGISRVEGSHVVTYDIKSGQVSQPIRYWSPQYVENARVHIEELVYDSIDKTKVADVPVHIFLSGGIDSTLVASRYQGGHAIHLESNETAYAKMVADKFNITLNTVHPAEVSATHCLVDYALKCGEPSAAGIIPYITAGEVCKHAKVAVTANGADELFFGYDRTQDHITPEQLAHMFRTGISQSQLELCSLPEIDPQLSQGRWLELMNYVQHDLNRTLDFAAMAHTVEVRAPFLDHRLVEHALSIPQAEHGRKDILKNMLRKDHGFDNEFLNRPKVGFSLHYTPKGMEKLKDEAMIWCVDNGWLPRRVYSKRDELYLRFAALSFYWWHKTFKSIIE